MYREMIQNVSNADTQRINRELIQSASADTKSTESRYKMCQTPIRNVSVGNSYEAYQLITKSTGSRYKMYRQPIRSRYET